MGNLTENSTALTCIPPGTNVSSLETNVSHLEVCVSDHPAQLGLSAETIISLIIYGLICVVGLIGNGLVIFVITRYTKMKTVTNMYILNLSIADFVFLLGMPMIMTTMLTRGWQFGFAFCKIYYMLTCINMFTGSFTLTVMSGDRFLAVCYPINSMRYRTPKYALIVIGLTWVISFIVMLPIVLYAQTIKKPFGGYTCTIKWPSENNEGSKIFTTYNLVLGFVIPVLLISVLYALLIVRLRTTSSAVKVDRRRPHRKVTRLVSMIIAVYIICWLPYWAFQVYLIFPRSTVLHLSMWQINIFKVFTMLSYANSMINPLLYAFTNENFRESFISAFKCARDPILGSRRTSEYTQNATICGEYNNGKSKMPKTREKETQYEFTMLNSDETKVSGQDESKCLAMESEKEALKP